MRFIERIDITITNPIPAGIIGRSNGALISGIGMTYNSSSERSRCGETPADRKDKPTPILSRLL